LKNNNIPTAKNISKYLKLDYPHVYNSLNRLVKYNKIYKTNERPAQYIIISEKMKIEEKLEKLKRDPALMLGLFRTMMDSSRYLRKIIINNVIEKVSQRDALKAWKELPNNEKEDWIKHFYLGENYNADTFINACLMLKNTKDEKLILRYLVENVK
jgi:hypothetical protein